MRYEYEYTQGSQGPCPKHPGGIYVAGCCKPGANSYSTICMECVVERVELQERTLRDVLRELAAAAAQRPRASLVGLAARVFGRSGRA